MDVSDTHFSNLFLIYAEMCSKLSLITINVAFFVETVCGIMRFSIMARPKGVNKLRWDLSNHILVRGNNEGFIK